MMGCAAGIPAGSLLELRDAGAESTQLLLRDFGTVAGASGSLGWNSTWT